MTSYKTTRRSYLSASAKLAAAGWLAARFPLQATEMPLPAGSYALNPLRPWVETTWTAPLGEINSSRDQRLRFSLMNWMFGRTDGAVRSVGRAELIRRVMPDRILYEWSMEHLLYSAGGTMSCRKDPGETAVSWVLRESSPRPGSAARSLTESAGRFSGGVVALVTLLGAPSAAVYWSDQTQPFLLTETGQAVLDSFRLERDSESEKMLPIGWRSLLLTGRGRLPRHLLLDESSLPLFFTAFGLSYVLEEVSNV